MNPHESKECVSKGSPITGAIYDLPRWTHYVWLIYVGPVFMPVFAPNQHSWRWLWLTIASLVVFLFLYERIIRAFRSTLIVPTQADELLPLLGMAVLAYALAPFNESASTYVCFCGAIAPLALRTLRRVVVFTLTLLGGYAIELSILGFNSGLFTITAVMSLAGALIDFMLVESRHKNVALRLSREEVHRMARVAERERIGRDLHDLLGHTLSLIAIKSELAAKLLERDRAAAAREVGEVTSIAREALKQVRTAVAGIRAAALENEIASARALLSTTGITLAFERDGAVLPVEIETALAMIVREAVTNIQRHSHARAASIEVITRAAAEADGGAEAGEKMVLMRVSDDGRGGVATRGNGLAGIAERVHYLGGALEIDSPRGKGTSLRVRLPLAAAQSRMLASANHALAQGPAVHRGPVELAEQPVSMVRT
jgi:two-component system sensor histidine kinase DesK